MKFHFPCSIKYTDDCTREVDEFCGSVSSKVLLCCSHTAIIKNVRLGKWIDDNQKSLVVYDNIQPNPTYEKLIDFVRKTDLSDVSLVVAFGGGSVIDTAKVISHLIGYSDFSSLGRLVLEKDVVRFREPGIPLILVPTTVGSGAEVTQFATIWLSAARQKRSFVASDATSRSVINDASLLASLPSEQLLYGGLDCISHALESIWNKNATEITRTMAVKALSLAVAGLKHAMSARDMDSLRALQIASNLAGLAISSTRTAIAHACSYPLTARYGVPHGLACSVFLEDIIKLNEEKLAEIINDANLLNNARELLQSFSLKEKVRSYLTADEFLSVKREIMQSSRAENYVFSAQQFVDSVAID